MWDKGRAFQRRGSWVALLTSPTKPSCVEACRVGRRHWLSMSLPDTESIQWTHCRVSEHILRTRCLSDQHIGKQTLLVMGITNGRLTCSSSETNHVHVTAKAKCGSKRRETHFTEYQRRTPASARFVSLQSPSWPHQVHLLLNSALQLPLRIGIQLASAWQEETEVGWLPLRWWGIWGQVGLVPIPR